MSPLVLAVFVLFFPLISALPRATYYPANATTTCSGALGLVTAPPACTEDCAFTVPNLEVYTWTAITETQNITAATVIYVVNTRRGTTRTVTSYNAISGYTPPEVNSDGTVITSLTFTRGPESTTEVVVLAYPTNFTTYEDRYTWEGTIRTTASTTPGCTVCSTASGQPVYFPSSPPYPQETITSLKYPDDYPAGGDRYGFNAFNQAGFGGLALDFVSALFPDERGLFVCDRRARAPEAVISTAVLLTATSTSFEGNDGSSHTSASASDRRAHTEETVTTSGPLVPDGPTIMTVFPTAHLESSVTSSGPLFPATFPGAVMVTAHAEITLPTSSPLVASSTEGATLEAPHLESTMSGPPIGGTGSLGMTASTLSPITSSTSTQPPFTTTQLAWIAHTESSVTSDGPLDPALHPLTANIVHVESTVAASAHVESTVTISHTSDGNTVSQTQQSGQVTDSITLSGHDGPTSAPDTSNNPGIIFLPETTPPPNASPAPPPVITLGSTTIPVAPESITTVVDGTTTSIPALVIGTETITPGEVLTVDNTPISIATTASADDGSPTALPGAPSASGYAPITTLGALSLPGSSPTGAAGSVTLVVGTDTITLPAGTPVFITETQVFTTTDAQGRLTTSTKVVTSTGMGGGTGGASGGSPASATAGVSTTGKSVASTVRWEWRRYALGLTVLVLGILV